MLPPHGEAALCEEAYVPLRHIPVGLLLRNASPSQGGTCRGSQCVQRGPVRTPDLKTLSVGNFPRALWQPHIGVPGSNHSQSPRRGWVTSGLCPQRHRKGAQGSLGDEGRCWPGLPEPTEAHSTLELHLLRTRAAACDRNGHSMAKTGCSRRSEKGGGDKNPQFLQAGHCEMG